jgi:hypothetical protein
MPASKDEAQIRRTRTVGKSIHHRWLEGISISPVVRATMKDECQLCTISSPGSVYLIQFAPVYVTNVRRYSLCRHLPTRKAGFITNHGDNVNRIIEKVV